jgi:hypothetical protein
MAETMVRQLWSLVVLVLLLAGQACETRGLSGLHVTRVEHAGRVVMLRVMLGEGFQNNTVSVRVDGKEVLQRSGVSTDWTISRADVVDVPTAAPNVQLDVEVENGPRLVQVIAPAHMPFVEVRFVNGELQLLPFDQEPPVL